MNNTSEHRGPDRKVSDSKATTRDPQNRRSNKMIDPKFQHSLVLRMAGMATFYFAFCVFVSIVLPMAFAIVTSDREAALAQVAFRLKVLFQVMLAPLLVTFAALWIQGMQESFRIAGPNYRFKAVCALLQDFCIPRGVRVRENDHLQDTAEAFDGALVALHDRIAEIQSKAARAVEAAHAATASSGEDAGSHAVDAAEEVHAALESFQLVSCAPACQAIVAGPMTAEAVVEPQKETVGS